MYVSQVLVMELELLSVTYDGGSGSATGTVPAAAGSAAAASAAATIGLELYEIGAEADLDVDWADQTTGPCGTAPSAAPSWCRAGVHDRPPASLVPGFRGKNARGDLRGAVTAVFPLRRGVLQP